MRRANDLISEQWVSINCPASARAYTGPIPPHLFTDGVAFISHWWVCQLTRFSTGARGDSPASSTLPWFVAGNDCFKTKPVYFI